MEKYKFQFGGNSKNENRKETVRMFHIVSEHLDEKIIKAFGKAVDADIVLYIGLCNGAGWVTKLREKTTVLLGIEKITELFIIRPIR